MRKDGSRFWASVVISPVYDDAGAHIGFAKVTRDQTESREHEEERRNSIAQQAHVLAVTAHELRTPSAVIDGSASTLRASWDQMSVADRDELLAGIQISAHRLRTLVSDLATASLLHGETLRLRLEDVSLTETLRGATARRQAAGAGVRIEVDVPHEVMVHADAGRLAQAVDNLLDNAIRHGAPPIGVLGAAVMTRSTSGSPTPGPAFRPSWFRTCSSGSPSPALPEGRGSGSTSCAKSPADTAARLSTIRPLPGSRPSSRSGSQSPPEPGPALRRSCATRQCPGFRSGEVWGGGRWVGSHAARSPDPACGHQPASAARNTRRERELR